MAAADEALRPRCVRFCATVSSRGGVCAFVQCRISYEKQGHEPVPALARKKKKEGKTIDVPFSFSPIFQQTPGVHCARNSGGRSS